MTNHKVHKYIRVTLGSNNYTVMKCVFPNCKHFIRVELALDRLSVCWRCGREFQLNQKNIKLKKPHCGECTHSKLDKKFESLGVENV